MIQARDLAIDVAARRVLSDASFTVAAGDKVGLVGRNGAGKTSLLKVLAAEDDAAAGLVLRRGTLGYVPQNPRPRSEAAHPALSHILSGRGLDSAAARLAELHQKLEHASAAPGLGQADRVSGHLLAVPGGAAARGEAADFPRAAAAGGDPTVEPPCRGDAPADGKTRQASPLDLHPRRANEGPARDR